MGRIDDTGGRTDAVYEAQAIGMYGVDFGCGTGMMWSWPEDGRKDGLGTKRIELIDARRRTV